MFTKMLKEHALSRQSNVVFKLTLKRSSIYHENDQRILHLLLPIFKKLLADVKNKRIH